VSTVAVAERLEHPAVWVGAWLVLALVLMGGIAASHEAVHNNLFRGRTANRVAGNIAAGAGFIPFASYRAYHLAHHADTKGASDPEPSTPVRGPVVWVLAMVLGGLQFQVECWSAVVGAAVGRPPRWARNAVHRAALRRAALLAVAQALLVAWLAINAPGPLLRWWIAPLLVLWVGGLGAMVIIPEHNELQAGGEATEWTRTTVSNPVFRWFFWNANLHTAHHLIPSVPWNHLPELHGLIEDRCPHVERGYLSYHRGLLRRDASQRPGVIDVSGRPRAHGVRVGEAEGLDLRSGAACIDATDGLPASADVGA
jgi:fatty acid desaturase